MAEKSIHDQMLEAIARTGGQGRSTNFLTPIKKLREELIEIRGNTPATVRSVVNSAARRARIKIIDGVHSRVNLTKKQIRQRTDVRLAGPGGSESAVIAGGDQPVIEKSKGQPPRQRKELMGQRIGLIEFGKPRWRRGSPQGAAVQISRSGTTFIGPVAGRTIGRGFIAQFDSGKMAVVSRNFRSINPGDIPTTASGELDRRFGRGKIKRRKGRLPLVVLRGPSVPGVLEGNEDLIVQTQALTRKEIVERLISRR